MSFAFPWSRRNGWHPGPERRYSIVGPMSASAKRKALVLFGSFTIAIIALHLLSPDTLSTFKLQQFALGFSYGSSKADGPVASPYQLPQSLLDAVAESTSLHEIHATPLEDSRSPPVNNESLTNNPSNSSGSGAPRSRVKRSRVERTQTAAATHIDDPLDLEHIRDFCSRKNWREGLVFYSGTQIDRVGDIRNHFLYLIRLAMEAGAAFVLPEIMARNPSDIDTQDWEPPHTSFDYMYNLKHLRQALQEACPQIQMFESLEASESVFKSPRILELDAASLESEGKDVPYLAHLEEWGSSLAKWMDSELGVGSDVSRENPVLVVTKSIGI